MGEEEGKDEAGDAREGVMAESVLALAHKCAF